MSLGPWYLTSLSLLLLCPTIPVAGQSHGPERITSPPPGRPANAEPGDTEPRDTEPRDDRDGGGVQRLDRIIVVGRRLADRAFDVPATVDSLDGFEIYGEKAFRTLPEAMREIPGVMVQKTGHGQGSPFIRGFTGFRTLVLIDDVRLNHSVMRSGPNQYWSTVDPLLVERLEILKGPASVLYGSDAIGGTVNVITRSPRLGGNGFSPGGRVHYRYASGEDSHGGRVEAEGSYSDDFGLLLGSSYKDFGDLIGGSSAGRLPNTGYDELDGDAKMVLYPRDDLEVVFALQRVDIDDAPRTHSTIFSKSFHGTTIGTDRRRDLDQNRHLAYAQVRWEPEDVEWLSAGKLGFSYQLHEEEENRRRGNGRTRRQGFEDDVFGAFVQLESETRLGTLSWGLEWYHDEVDSFFREFEADGSPRPHRPRGPVADDASYDLAGLYLQDAFSVRDDLEVTLGGRFNYAHAEAAKVDPDPSSAPELGPVSEDFSSVVGSLRGVYHATEEWNIFTGVSQGFRAPNLSDLTRFDVSRSGEVEIPSPDLRPEDFVAFEAGTKIRLESIELQASYHYTIIDGMIVRFPTGQMIAGDPAVTKDNVGDGFTHGVELGARWRLGRGFTLFGSAGWVEGEVDSIVDGAERSQPSSRMPPAMGILGLRWDSPSRRWWVEGTVTIADGQDRLSPRDRTDTQRIPPGGTPGYTIYSMRAGGRIRDGLHGFIGVENFTNKDYRIHGSGQDETGTNAIVGLDWTFGGPRKG